MRNDQICSCKAWPPRMGSWKIAVFEPDELTAPRCSHDCEGVSVPGLVKVR